MNESVARKSIRNRIAWITGVLQQGYVQADQTKAKPKSYPKKQIKQDRVPLGSGPRNSVVSIPWKN
ncbi:hypothetical protein BEP19_00425 [Ammoniphilus oxalaticus]|uniref:Uncharacterized protein n=1 Tax=Ammoniphilus oxalaticus TaxID=66863 RepID=A0A419SRK0_9BACL|nr:hypothetical protein BEP19_00425 [Ammoniphilus oxalaticus]